MDTQWAAPILRTAFPGKPILAHFTLRAEEERDTAAAASLLATLAGAGYTVTEAQAEELLGFPVTYHAPAAPQPFTNSDPEPPTDPTDPAPLTNTTDPTPAPTEAEEEADAPLTEAELTALRSLTSAPLSPASLTPALSSALTSALTNRTDTPLPEPPQEEQGDDDSDPDPDTDPEPPTDPEDNPDPDPEPPTDPEDNPDGTPAPPEETAPTQATADPEEEDVENGLKRGQRRDRRGRFTGKNHKGTTRVSKGKRKRNVPAIAPENASDQKKVSALDHAFKKVAKRGNVYKAAKIRGKYLHVKHGHPKYAGVSHLLQHDKRGDSSPRQAVRALVYGKVEPDEEPGKTRFKRGNIHVVTTEEKRSRRIITSHKTRK